MKCLKKIPIFFLFLLVLLPIINAVAPAQVQTNINIDVGLDIDYPKINPLKVNQSFLFNFQVYNRSNGLKLNNVTTNCSFHLVNSSGHHIFISDLTPFNNTLKHWELNVKGGNFSDIGRMSYSIECISLGNVGGFASSPFIITESGFAINEGNATLLYTIILFMMVIGTIFLIAFTKKEDKFQIKWTFFVVGYILFLSALTLTQISLRDSLVNPVIISYLDSFLAIAFILFWFSFGLLMVMWFLTTLQTLLLRKAKRNMEKFA